MKIPFARVTDASIPFDLIRGRFSGRLLETGGEKRACAHAKHVALLGGFPFYSTNLTH